MKTLLLTITVVLFSLPVWSQEKSNIPLEATHSPPQSLQSIEARNKYCEQFGAINVSDDPNSNVEVKLGGAASDGVVCWRDTSKPLPEGAIDRRIRFKAPHLTSFRAYTEEEKAEILAEQKASIKRQNNNPFKKK